MNDRAASPPRDNVAATASIAALYQCHLSGLRRHALRYVGCEDVAEDVVHEVFRRIIKRARHVHSRLTPAYLYQAVRNEALRWVEQRRFQHSHTEAVRAALHSPAPSPEDQMDGRDRRGEILKAMDTLPQRGRQAFLLVYVEGRSYVESAKIMDISPETIKVHLRRARRALRARLEADSAIE